MQLFFGRIGLALALWPGLALADPLPEKGAMTCMIGSDLGLVGWRTAESGTVEMLGAMAGETATIAGDSLVIAREGTTIILRKDQVVWSQESETTTGPCQIVTEEVQGLAAALQ